MSQAGDNSGVEISEVLCRPGLGLACAACCPPIRPAGYDHADHRDSLPRLFRDNRAAWLRGQLPQRHELGFWCPGLGYLDDLGRRVGCLLHPEQNQGRDLRVLTGYADKCRREWCQEARAWAALVARDRRSLLQLCAGMDSLDFGSQRRNPLRRLLALGPEVASGGAELGLASRQELAALPWLEELSTAWGWLLGLALEAQGTSVLTWPGLVPAMEQAIETLRRRLGPQPPLEQGPSLADMGDQWEARFWRGLSGRIRARQEDVERWRLAAKDIVAAGQWR